MKRVAIIFAICFVATFAIGVAVGSVALMVMA